MQPRVICVAGAVTYDYLIYPMTLVDGDFHAELEEQRDLAQLVIRTGSADLVAQLLTAAAPQWNFDVLSPELQSPTSNCLKHNASSIVDLSYNNSLSNAPSSLSVVQVRNIGKRPVWHSPSIEQASTVGASTVVLTGSGDAFQDVEPALDFLQRVHPKYIVHHMTRPLAKGSLWDIIRNGPMVRNGVPDPNHLAVIIDADDLRAEGIALSRSLSWEATAEDFVRNLGSNGRLDTLVTCPNLIVRFGNEGVIHHRGREATDPKLYFHPRHMEKTRANHQMTGLTDAFTAGFAIGFPDSEQGIRLGITAAERLSQTGFVLDERDNQSPQYPIGLVMDRLRPETEHSTVDVPSNRISSGDSFTIFKALTGDLREVARKIVTMGPDRTLARCSVKQFDDLRIVDRIEQESMGSIVDTMNERLQSGNINPTCIGINGPVGSGKKFVARNLSDHVGRTWPIRKLALDTRVMRLEDLTRACHAIRDNNADNYLTVVSFENFECLLEQDNTLFDEFAAVMRHGKFGDAGHERGVGRCLLFFLVNKESTPDIMQTPASQTNFTNGRSVDDAALQGNLHGVVRLTGPNEVDEQDRMTPMSPIRRALMLRQLLKERHPHLIVDGTIKIDDAVLYALLFGPKYKHGLRSLEKIISTSRLSGRKKFDVSALPPEEQIQLHVDGPVFMGFLRSPKLPAALRETLAEGMFEAYKKQKELMADTPEKRKKLQSDSAMVDWDELSGEYKESTRAQADDIPRKLRQIECFMLNERRSYPPFIHVPAFTEDELIMLSEMEHERFNAERLQRQWRMGERDSEQRKTPFLIPWRDLPQEWKDVDSVMVECVPRVLKNAGYYIYREDEKKHVPNHV